MGVLNQFAIDFIHLSQETGVEWLYLQKKEIIMSSKIRIKLKPKPTNKFLLFLDNIFESSFFKVIRYLLLALGVLLLLGSTLLFGFCLVGAR